MLPHDAPSDPASADAAARPPVILVVDDDQQLTRILGAALTNSIAGTKTRVLAANSGARALEIMATEELDLVLLDLYMPDMNGLEVCRRFKQIPGREDVPVVLFTGYDTAQNRVAGFELGIVDFIPKPFELAEIRARVGAHLRNKLRSDQINQANSVFRSRAQAELREIEERYLALLQSPVNLIFETTREARIVTTSPLITRALGYVDGGLEGTNFHELLHPEDLPAARRQMEEAFRSFGHLGGTYRFRTRPGEWRWLEANFKPFVTASGSPHCLVTCRDVTEREEYERNLEFMASHDLLTGLHNRKSFENHLARACSAAVQGTPSVVLYLDLDNFKTINDTIGHAAGDSTLRQIGEILKSVCGPAAVASRFGGDEFGVLLSGHRLDQGVAVAGRIREAVMALPVAAGNFNPELGCSIGVVPVEPPADTETLLSRVDSALHVAKSRGKNRVEIFRIEDREIEQRRADLGWTTRVKAALRGEQFEVWIQPVVSLHDGSTSHYECLLRMRDEDQELVPPTVFLPAAERAGLMAELDRKVITTCLPVLQRYPGVCFAINLSGDSLNREKLAETIERLFAGSAVDPARVIFEITESIFISNLAQARRIVHRLQQHGFRFALDDFGTGFSSLAYLRELPVEYLKIDAGFIARLGGEEINRLIVRTISDVARATGKHSIAEFVEDQETLEQLRQLGIDFAQGNITGPALSPERYLGGAAD